MGANQQMLKTLLLLISTLFEWKEIFIVKFSGRKGEK